ncbi:MAG: alpha/beta hydrolase [Epsilonproteobacteria bacterium]|nr:2-hydroxy-6-oxohepta-2,4-dienoate hydrolase [Campylobacterota bacterium]NPA56605.1 alpha/beta hydrolase [Campylobacterota bacterium]
MKNRKRVGDIIFLHGWGSNKEIMKGAFGNLLPEFRHVYIDLPGFGKSPNDKVLNSRKYAQIVDAFLDEVGVSKDIVVGHSFGGKVATLLEPRLLVLLSSAGIVCPKPWTIRMKIALFKMLKPFGGQKIRRFFVAEDAKNMGEAMYATFKNVVNEDFRNIFASYTREVLLFWGKGDMATPLKSGEIMRDIIPRSKLIVLDGDHYFFLHHSGEIAQKIKEHYGKLSM